MATHMMIGEIMDKLKNFVFADGNIKSILLDKSDVKVLFRSWDDTKCHIIFEDSFYLRNNDVLHREVDGVTIERVRKGVSKTWDEILELYEGYDPPYMITFFEAWESKPVLEVVAMSVEIVDGDEGDE